jgi:DNA-binding MarR family transcriptional regulator
MHATDHPLHAMPPSTTEAAPSGFVQLRLEHQLCFAVYSLSNSIQKAYRPLLAPLDLTYPQYLVMLVLWQDEGISVKQLGAQLGLDSGTLTPLLKRLAQKNLVERRHSDEDERARALYLTPSGKAMQQQAAAIPQQLIQQLGLDLAQLVPLKQQCEQMKWQLQHSNNANADE